MTAVVSAPTTGVSITKPMFRTDLSAVTTEADVELDACEEIRNAASTGATGVGHPE